MFIEILLGALFVISAGAFWYLFSLKLPELILIPDHVITEQIKKESTKFHVFLLYFKSFFRDERYKDVFARIGGKFLYRLHIVLMRLDNAVMSLLRAIRTQQNAEVVKPQEEPMLSPELDEVWPSNEQPPLPAKPEDKEEPTSAPIVPPPQFVSIAPVMAPPLSSVVVRKKALVAAAEIKEQGGVQQIPLARKTSLNTFGRTQERRMPEKTERSGEPILEEMSKRRVRRSKIVPPEIRE